MFVVIASNLISQELWILSDGGEGGWPDNETKSLLLNYSRSVLNTVTATTLDLLNSFVRSSGVVQLIFICSASEISSDLQCKITEYQFRPISADQTGFLYPLHNSLVVVSRTFALLLLLCVYTQTAPWCLARGHRIVGYKRDRERDRGVGQQPLWING